MLVKNKFADATSTSTYEGFCRGWIEDCKKWHLIRVANRVLYRYALFPCFLRTATQDRPPSLRQ